MNQIAHTRTAFNPFNRHRAIIFSVVAVALAALSFDGALDNLAFSKLGDLMKESFGYLLLSRGVNAAVSVLQTIEFSIYKFSSAQVGQVLDPINDAAERLSVALMWAIGSLFLQETLLKIASGWIFKWGFLAISLMMATSLLLFQSDRVRSAFATTFGISHLTLAQFQGFLIRTFVIATLFRFIVPTFMVASFLVSQALVAPEMSQHAGELKRHEKGLSEMGARISEARDEVINVQKNQDEIPTTEDTQNFNREEETQPASTSPSDQAAARQDVEDIGEQRVQLETKFTSLQAEKERLTIRINEIGSSGSSGKVLALMEKLVSDPDEALAEADARVEQNVAEVESKEWELACIEGHSTGEKCDSFLAEHRKQVLGELKTQLESELTELREKIQSHLEEREKHLTKISGEAGGEKGLGLSGKIMEALPDVFSGDSAEETEAAKAKIEDLDREAAKVKALETRKAAELECVERLTAGGPCDSFDEDALVQPVLDRLKARLESEIQPLRAELASLRDERERLAEMGDLKADRKQIESDIEKTTALVAQKDSELECAKRRVVGEDCDTFLDDVGQVISTTGTVTNEMVSRATDAAGKGLSTAGQAAGRVVSSVTEATNRAFSKMSLGVLDRFKAIVDGAEDMVTGMVNILILVVIENIALPIIFLAIALKGSVPIARGLIRISTSIGEDTREALSALDQALPGRTN